MKNVIALAAAVFVTQFAAKSAMANGTDAAANLSGHWVSTSATISDITGKKTACTKVEITMSSAPGKLTTESYKATCPSMDTDWGPDPMTIAGDKVMNSDQDQIGTFQNDDLETAENEDGVVYLFNLQVLPPDASGHRHAKSLYGAQNMIGQMTVEADMVEQP